MIKNLECEKTDGIYTGKRIGDFLKKKKKKDKICEGENYYRRIISNTKPILWILKGVCMEVLWIMIEDFKEFLKNKEDLNGLFKQPPIKRKERIYPSF